MSERFKKFIFIFFGFVVLVLVAEGAYYYFTIYKKPPKAPPEKPPVEKVEREWLPVTPILDKGFTPENNLEIAALVLEWLEEQKDERGIYYFSRYFDTVGSRYQEVPSGTSGHIGIAPIWGRFKHYQASGEENDLKILARDLAAYTDKNKIESIQNDFWNCSLMFELWQSDSFSADQKKKIKEICWESAYYYPADLSSITTKKLIDDQLREVVEIEIEDLELEKVADKSISFKTPLAGNDGNFLFQYLAHPADSVARYFWEKDENDLKRAKFYFNKAVQLFVQKEELFEEKEICLLGVSAVDIFRATQKEDYLNFSLSLFEKVKVDSDKLKPPVCAFFSQRLFEETEEPQYLDSRIEILQALIDEAFDFPQYGGYLVGEGGFRDIEEDGGVGSTKSIRENGLIVGLLVSK